MPRGKSWHAHEDAALTELFEELNPAPGDMAAWDRLAERLPQDVARDLLGYT